MGKGKLLMYQRKCLPTYRIKEKVVEKQREHLQKVK